MELSFNGGRFVSFEGELNYKEVLKDFPTAKTIRILTYNISNNWKRDALLDALRTSSADVQIITNVPSRMDEYYDSDAGRRKRYSARKNINIYISKLNPSNFTDRFIPFFCVNNHAKIIGTENIVYIGSANYSNESADSIETGVLIEDRNFIRKLYTQFFDKVKEGSLSYYDENFSAFRLFALSLYAKFKHHLHKLLADLYTDYERSNLTVADTIFLDISYLHALYQDIEEFEALCVVADNTYDDENDEYNDAMEELKKRLDSIETDWLKEVVSDDGSLFRLVNYNVEQEAQAIIQTKYAFEAYDEYFDHYAEVALQRAIDIYSYLHDCFTEEANAFLEEIKKILGILELAISFTSKWKATKINPKIDNT